jgi:DNA-binding NarL/FixJ family response regulator
MTREVPSGTMTARNLKSQKEIRVMLVDDHLSFRQGLTALITNESDLTVVAEAGTGQEAIDLYRQKEPDVVLMDLRLPGMGGVEATIAIRKEFPEALVIVLTTFETDEDIYRAIQSGAKSYLLKDTPYPEIAQTVRRVHGGQQILSPKIASLLDKRQQRGDLSEREMAILQLLVKGRSNKEIGASLFIAEDTVKTHLKNLFVKLDVHDRTGAVISAIRHGIVHLE